MSEGNRKAWYALRRTMPPWSFDDNLAELIACLPRYGVDEVIVKVDAETFSHGHTPLQWVRDYLPKLIRVRDAMDRLGIVYSINPWFTLGHCDRGWDGSSTPDIERLVGHDGAKCKECACPLSQGWREYFFEVWRLYAETGPKVLWVEDDIRTFNHTPAEFGCFCPAHMKMFSRRIGEKVTRKKLVRSMLRPGKPHPWRAEFLAMQGEIMVDVARRLSKAVHAANPGVSLGLMSSGHHYHGIEGRKWTAFADALADGRPFFSRPPLGIYTETVLHELYYNPDSIKGARHVLPDGANEQAEVDNAFFSLYTCGAAMTFLKIATSFAYGCHGVTMNLFDHNGTPMEKDLAFGRLLAENKPFYDGLTEACGQPGTYRGVQLLHHSKTSSVTHLAPGASYRDMDPHQHECMEQLEALGIPTTYDEESVVSASGQVIRALSKKQIRKLLAGGLLLDGVAARALTDRGFGEAIGLKKVADPRSLFEIGPYNAEEFFHPDYGGADHTYLVSLFGPNSGPPFCELKPAKDATVISRFVDPDIGRGPASMIAYQNALGGRIVVQGFDLGQAYGDNYCRPERVQQMQGVIRWLSQGKIPVLVRGDGAWPLGLRKDYGDRTVLGFFNLSLDPWPAVEFEIQEERDPSSIRKLGMDGAWSECEGLEVTREGERLLLRYARPVPHGEPLFLRLVW